MNRPVGELMCNKFIVFFILGSFTSVPTLFASATPDPIVECDKDDKAGTVCVIHEDR